MAAPVFSQHLGLLMAWRIGLASFALVFQRLSSGLLVDHYRPRHQGYHHHQEDVCLAEMYLINTMRCWKGQIALFLLM